MHEQTLTLVREYHEKFHPDQKDMTPSTGTEELVEFRHRLFNEESQEAHDEFMAVEDGAYFDGATRPAQVARLMHELADVVIVAYGTAMRLGVDLDEVMHAVMQANMAKVPNPDPAGKAIKPPGFVPASARVLEIVERAA